MGIAAASILAKDARDAYIQDLCETYPILSEWYCLNNNMGYGTKHHLEGIKNYGITQWHRKTYSCCTNKKINFISPLNSYWSTKGRFLKTIVCFYLLLKFYFLNNNFLISLEISLYLVASSACFLRLSNCFSCCFFNSSALFKLFSAAFNLVSASCLLA